MNTKAALIVGIPFAIRESKPCFFHQSDWETTMKTIYIAALIFSASGLVNAGNNNLVSDGSDYGNICIAAVKSVKGARVQAEKMGMSRSDWNNLECNGMHVKKFARKYSTQEPQADVHTFVAGNSQPATQICMAAIEAPQTLDSLAERHFGISFDIESSIECNGQSIGVSMKRFREDGVAVVE